MDKNQLAFEEFSVPDRFRIHKVKKIAKEYFGNKKGQVLELGACRGGLAEELAKDGWEAYGIDINHRKIPKVNFIQHDLNRGIPINKEFDLIFAGEVIEHIYNDRKFLSNVYNKLKPGGLFILTTPNLHFTINRILVLFGKDPMVFAPYHYHVYSINEMKKLLYSVGFKKIYKISSTHVLVSSVRFGFIGKIFEFLGDIFPSFGRGMIIAVIK